MYSMCLYDLIEMYDELDSFARGSYFQNISKYAAVSQLCTEWLEYGAEITAPGWTQSCCSFGCRQNRTYEFAKNPEIAEGE